MAGLIVLALGAAGGWLLVGGDGGGPGDDGRAPTWRTRVQLQASIEGYDVAATADSVVVRIGRSVVGLDRRTGQQRWSYKAKDGDVGDFYADVAVAGNVVAVSGRKKGEGLWLDVLDTASGRKLWSHKAKSGEVTVLQDAVYTADCARDCVVSKRDLRTGEDRWTLNEPPATQVMPPDLGARIGKTEARALQARPSGAYVLLARGDGRKAGDRFTVLDAGTGRRLTGVRNTGWTGILTPRSLVVGEPVDEREEDPACRYSLRAHGIRDGKPQWRGEVSTHFSKRDDKSGCSGLLTTGDHALGIPPDALIATTADGRPQAFDLAAGKPRWAAQRRGVPIDAGPRVVLVRDTRESGPIRALDPATGRELWQAPDPEELTADTAVAGDSVLIRYRGGNGGRTAVLNAADGRQRWTSQSGSGNLAGAGDDWFAMVPSRSDQEGPHDILFYELSR
ncbi:PQQ-binding-like beta-propeller repeat protein [Actinomadura vinacea]